jgi:hypothetical protein
MYLLTKNHNEKADLIDGIIVGIVFGGICFVIGCRWVVWLAISMKNHQIAKFTFCR